MKIRVAYELKASAPEAIDSKGSFCFSRWEATSTGTRHLPPSIIMDDEWP